MPWRAAINIVAQLADVLRHLHGRKILFRDVKADNFMLGDGRGHGEEGRVYVVDFGAVTKFVLHNGQQAAGGAGMAGTPTFMSRHAMANAPPRPRDDLESLGYLLVWMLNRGTLPWDRASGLEEISLAKHTTSVSDLCKSISPKAARDACEEYLEYVWDLDVDEVPEYDHVFAALLRRIDLKRIQDAPKALAAELVQWRPKGKGRSNIDGDEVEEVEEEKEDDDDGDVVLLEKAPAKSGKRRSSSSSSSSAAAARSTSKVPAKRRLSVKAPATRLPSNSAASGSTSSRAKLSKAKGSKSSSSSSSKAGISSRTRSPSSSSVAVPRTSPQVSRQGDAKSAEIVAPSGSRRRSTRLVAYAALGAGVAGSAAYMFVGGGMGM